MIIRKEEMVKEVRHRPFDGPGDVVFNHLLPAELLKGEAKMFNLLEFPPGSGLGMHQHSDNFEIYYILEGTATVDDDGQAILVGPGDLVYTADGAKHAITNTGDDVLKMIATVVFENKN